MEKGKEITIGNSKNAEMLLLEKIISDLKENKSTWTMKELRDSLKISQNTLNKAVCLISTGGAGILVCNSATRSRVYTINPDWPIDEIERYVENPPCGNFVGPNPNIYSSLLDEFED